MHGAEYESGAPATGRSATRRFVGQSRIVSLASAVHRDIKARRLLLSGWRSNKGAGLQTE